MRGLKQPLPNWNADYGAGGGNFIGVGVASGEGVGDSCGVADGDSVAVGVAVSATVACAVGDDSGNAWDALEGRHVEIWMSDSRRTTVPTTAAIPPILAQNSVF